MTNPDKIRLGILGAARIAPMAVVRPAARVPEVEIRTIATRDPARARAFAQKHHLPRVHETYDALLSDPEIAAVYIPLPNSLHAQWSIRALQAGKHVLCEKPMAANADEAGRMAVVAAESGRLLVEAFHYRYHPLTARIKAIVDSGELGVIRHLEAHLCLPVILPGHIAYRYDLAGGATMDLGCYPVNLIRYLAGAEPQVILAQAGLASAQIDRWMKADFRFADGRTAHMFCSIRSLVVLRARLVVVGDQGELRVTCPFHPHYYHRLSVRLHSGETRREHVDGETTFVHQLRAFANAIRGNTPMPTDAQDAIANMRVIDAIYERAGLKRRGT